MESAPEVRNPSVKESKSWQCQKGVESLEHEKLQLSLNQHVLQMLHVNARRSVTPQIH